MPCHSACWDAALSQQVSLVVIVISKLHTLLLQTCGSLEAL